MVTDVCVLAHKSSTFRLLKNRFPETLACAVPNTETGRHLSQDGIFLNKKLLIVYANNELPEGIWQLPATLSTGF